jgi:zinc protease
MLFKGTESRGVGQIASLVEGAGGDINAYTTFDKTVFYLTLPAGEAKLGFDVLSDAIFASSFDDGEFEREKEVILEEIKRGNDDPGGQIGRKIFQDLYEGSEAGRPIIGFSEEVKGFTRETLMNFWKTWYRPENMSLVVVGQLSEEDARSLAEKYFGMRAGKSSGNTRFGSGRHSGIRRVVKEGVRAVIIDGDFEQTRVDVAIGAPAIDDPDSALVDTAAYVLGGSEVSRLQRRLKEKEAIVNAIGASAYTPAFEGVFEVSAALEPEHFSAAIKSIGRELGLLMNGEPPTDQEIERARAASRIGRIHREETVDGVARALVSGLATPMKEKFEGIYEGLLNGFKPEDVTLALQREWSLSRALIVVLCDKGHRPKEEDLVKAFTEGVLEGQRKVSKKPTGVIAAKRTVTTHKFEIANGIPVVYRQIPDARMFSIAMATEGGLRGEEVATSGIFHATATLLGLATKSKSYEAFSGRIEDMGTVLGGFSGKDSLGFEMHCTEDQVEEMVKYLAEAMLEPSFPDKQWESYRRETLESLKLQQDSASWICMRRLHQEVFGRHPYSLPISGIEKTIKNFSANALERSFETWRDHGPWVVSVAGGANPDSVRKYLTDSFGRFTPDNKKRKFPGTVIEDLKVLGIPESPRRKQEQAHIALAGAGPKWGDSGRAAVDVLVNILGGHGGRLFTTLRDQESLAYSVSPLHSQGVFGGMIGAYIATSTDKVDQACAGLDRELRKISAEGPTDDEITRSKAYILGSHEVGLQRTSSQAMTMALMELYGMGWDDFETYPDLIRGVTGNEIKKIAAQYFDPKAMKRVIVGGRI